MENYTIRNKYVKLIYSIIFFYAFLFITNFSYSSYVKDGIDSFPVSYQPYLRELQRKYPNWVFKALYTDLDWNTVVNAQQEYGRSLVPKNYSDNWKNKTPRNI